MMIGENATIDESVRLPNKEDSDTDDALHIGADAVIRAGTIIYPNVDIGDGFTTGHNVLVREHSTIGDDVLVGTNAVIDGSVSIGSNVSVQSCAYIPPESTIGDEVFLGPATTLANDPHPIRTDAELEGPVLKDHVSVGANATLLPGVTVGNRSFIGAGSVVTRDVAPETLAVGVPAEHRPLPDELRGGNRIA